MIIFKTFQALKISTLNYRTFHTFPGSVRPLIIIIIMPAVPQHSCGCGIQARSAWDETLGDCQSPNSHIQRAADLRWRPGHVDVHTDLCGGSWSIHSVPMCLNHTASTSIFILCTHTHTHT